METKTKEQHFNVLYTKEEAGVFYQIRMSQTQIDEALKTGYITKPVNSRRTFPEKIRIAYIEWKNGNFDFIIGQPRLKSMSAEQIPKWAEHHKIGNKVINTKGKAPKIPTLAEMLANPPTFSLLVTYPTHTKT